MRSPPPPLSRTRRAPLPFEQEKKKPSNLVPSNHLMLISGSPAFSDSYCNRFLFHPFPLSLRYLRFWYASTIIPLPKFSPFLVSPLVPLLIDPPSRKKETDVRFLLVSTSCLQLFQIFPLSQYLKINRNESIAAFRQLESRQ